MEAEAEAEHALSANLETRRKRRESGPRLNIRRVSVFESPEDAEEGTTKAMRSGSKRKFSVQEDEDKESSKTEQFRFSRRNTPGASESEVSHEESRPSSSERPVLSASKKSPRLSNWKLISLEPVNTDPMVSPKKQRSSVQEKSEKIGQPVSKAQGRPRLNITRNNLQPNLPPLHVPEPTPTADIILDSLPPKTPAVEDVFSPPTTEPSTQRPESKDTPPPSDLISSDHAGQAGRPGRRARPQVSYKEPSLNTKMRRPDAKLVDAIVNSRASMEHQIAPPTTIKRESTGELSWKPISAVSGQVAGDDAEVGSPLRQKLDRRDQDLKITSPADQLEGRSTTSKAISALINETSTAKRKVAAQIAGTGTFESQVEKPLSNAQHPPRIQSVKEEPCDKDRLAVFDFTDSSPAEAAPQPRSRVTDLAKAARNARRHSAMPASSSTTIGDDRKLDRSGDGIPTLHKRTGSETVKSASTTTLSKGTTSLGRSASGASRPSVKEKKVIGAGVFPTSGNNSDLHAKVEALARDREPELKAKETTALRAERAASRRKSMML